MSKKQSAAQASGTVNAKASAAKNVANQNFAVNTVQKLDALYKTREKWEATDFKKSNEGLYGLLAECLGVFDASFTKVSNDQRRALRSELTTKLSAAGVKVQKNTTVLMMLVRFVFNSDRKRAHGYVTVLTAAIEYGISSVDLPNFIVESGGVEEIKRRQVKTAEAIAKQQKIENAKAEVKSAVELAAIKPLASVQIEGVTGNYALLLVAPSLHGTADVVGTLSDLPDSMVTTLIARMAKARVSKQLKAEIESKADQDLLDAALCAKNDPQMRKAA